jgi:hypothetical protein
LLLTRFKNSELSAGRANVIAIMCHSERSEESLVVLHRLPGRIDRDVSLRST